MSLHFSSFKCYVSQLWLTRVEGVQHTDRNGSALHQCRALYTGIKTAIDVFIFELDYSLTLSMRRTEAW